MMHIPRATYRIQFTPTFGWKRLEEILPYLAALGISDIYASPIFQARPGSTHGYDVVDPDRLNPELGTAEEFSRLRARGRELGLSWIQDIVPNHMAFDSGNRMLMNVFELGEGSPFYRTFDIDWEYAFENLRGKVIAPFLGKFFGRCLEDGELQLAYEDGTFFITYYQLRFPLKITTYPKILGHRVERLEQTLGQKDARFISFLGTLYSFQQIDLTRKDPPLRPQVDQVKTTLRNLVATIPEIGVFLEETVSHLNGKVGDPSSFDALEELLSHQMFHLAYWKVAGSEINYRRFFNINELISVRVEDPAAFTATHQLLLRLLKEKAVDGLRIDHIDGLSDPETYLNRLREAAPDAYIVVEKILEGDERLPASWPVQGTTGYDALNLVNEVFCQTRHAEAFLDLYRTILPEALSPEEMYLDKQRLIVARHLKGNINNLASFVKRIASRDRFGRDLTAKTLKQAMIEVLTFFPVYRSYIRTWEVDEQDRQFIQTAIDKALELHPDLNYELEFIRKFFLLQFSDTRSDAANQEWLTLVMQLQQYTGPVMAKGVEDTFFYVYNRLGSLNEVGGNPIEFGAPLSRLHRFFSDRRQRMPHSLNASGTHDTKRGEDVRARINVLSEIPQEWAALFGEWQELNRPARGWAGGAPIPDPNDEYLLYQTLIGALPFSGIDAGFVQRIKDYLIKAIREAKVHTDWVQQNREYESGCLTFIDSLLAGDRRSRFLDVFLPFAKRVALLGAYGSLSQTLLKMTLPGVPDFYQGSELWDLSLVDPDNRRPIDFGLRQRLLAEVRSQFEREGAESLRFLFQDLGQAKPKLFLIWRTLQARQRLADLFREGDYSAVAARGTSSDCVISFARRHGDRRLVVVAPRFFTQLGVGTALPLGLDVWKDTTIDLGPEGAGRWSDLLTDRPADLPPRPAVGKILCDFPVALLLREGVPERTE